MMKEPQPTETPTVMFGSSLGQKIYRSVSRPARIFIMDVAGAFLFLYFVFIIFLLLVFDYRNAKRFKFSEDICFVVNNFEILTTHTSVLRVLENNLVSIGINVNSRLPTQ